MKHTRVQEGKPASLLHALGPFASPGALARALPLGEALPGRHHRQQAGRDLRQVFVPRPTSAPPNNGGSSPSLGV